MGMAKALQDIEDWKNSSRVTSPQPKNLGEDSPEKVSRTTSLGSQEREVDGSFRRTLSSVTSSMRTMFRKTSSQTSFLSVPQRNPLNLFVKMSDIVAERQSFDLFVQQLLYDTFSLPDGSTLQRKSSPHSEENLSLPLPTHEPDRLLILDFEGQDIPKDFLEKRSSFYRLLSEPGIINKIVLRNLTTHTETEALQHALHVNPTLKELALSYNKSGSKITHEAAAVISYVVKQPRTPQDFSFEDIPDAANIFLLENSIITKFGFLDKPFETGALDKVIAAVKQSGKKLDLTFAKVDLSDTDGEKIADLLDSGTLVSLDLNTNHLGDKTAEKLSEKLKTNKSLVSLNLSKNHITGTGFVALGRGLQNNKTLIDLHVGGENTFTIEGFLELIKALKINKNLTLHVTRSQIKDLENSLKTLEFDGELEPQIKMSGSIQDENLIKFKPRLQEALKQDDHLEAPKPGKSSSPLPIRAIPTGPKVTELQNQVGGVVSKSLSPPKLGAPNFRS